MCWFLHDVCQNRFCEYKKLHTITVLGVENAPNHPSVRQNFCSKRRVTAGPRNSGDKASVTAIFHQLSLGVL
ncbi:hypothetical protein TcWFU_004086 [Taenia crassiceps]|uniref:Uncharacterized protein n=1 Tax=Taenia crassiceps TaxID=6207 RepID=A0ABR4PZX5_9CEST